MKKSIAHACLEEAGYAGVLQTQHIALSLPRFILSHAIASTATRGALGSLPIKPKTLPSNSDSNVDDKPISESIKEIVQGFWQLDHKATHLWQIFKGLSIDHKIGFIWAIHREIIVSWCPSSYAIPALTLADSAVFALSEVAPAKNLPHNMIFVPFSSPWNGKVLSSFFFRALANTFTLNKGFGVSLIGHVLFNISSQNLPQ